MCVGLGVGINIGVGVGVIVSAGIGYSTDTTIQVKSAGSNAFFDSEVRSLTINKFQKYG